MEASALELTSTVPTTSAGIIAAITYMRMEHAVQGEHMVQGWDEDEDGARFIDWLDSWLETLTRAVDVIRLDQEEACEDDGVTV
jgi:hypothetical protein